MSEKVKEKSKDEIEEESNLLILKNIHENKKLTINGNDYTISTITHKERVKALSLQQHIMRVSLTNPTGLLLDPYWQDCEDFVFPRTMRIGQRLDTPSVLEDWSEKFGGDYVKLVTTVINAFAYPFLQSSP